MKLLFCKTDIIYAVDADTLLVAGIIKKIKNLFLVYDAHEFFEESPEIINKKWIQKIWHLITQFGVNNSHLCISVGEQISHLLSTQFGKQFHTIRNLPDQVMESNSSLTREKIIWYQGVLNIGRGLEEMIECMPFLPDYKFLLAGDGDITQLLKNKVKDLNLEDRILFLGKLNKEELISNNRKAYIGINLLSSDSKNYYYSLANRTFDYIYATLPSIHMNFPEYNSLINKYEFGILLESLNKSEIISAIQKLEEPAFYEHCLEQCKKAAMQNSWKLESEKLIQLINVMHKS
ncbi:MAG: glycosyltransferase [Saprospiraceae bacterium]